MMDGQKKNDIEQTNEQTTDDIELVDTEERSEDALKKAKKKIRQCEKEKSELFENLQRAKADFLNSKKRFELESIRSIQRAANEHILKLLPLCDSFELAMSDKKAWQSIDETWRKGIEGIYGQLQSLLAEYDVEVINPLGKQFDPNFHEAVSTVQAPEKKEDTVVEVLQVGYKRNGDVIKPAKVILSN